MDLVLGQSTSFPADATHVPTFYVPDPTFYVPTYDYTSIPTSGDLLLTFLLRPASYLLVLIPLGILFGGIHCAGWYLLFLTYTEQNLWRVASVTVTIYPYFGIVVILIVLIVVLVVLLIVLLLIILIVVLIVLIFCLILGLILGRTDLIFPLTFFVLPCPAIFKFFSDHGVIVFNIGISIFTIIFVLGYVFTRLLLLGLAIALLRYQPPNVFITIDWTKFYPHIF